MTLSRLCSVVLAGISGGILALVIAYRSLWGYPLISLVNRSSYELSSVQVDGRGFSDMLPNIQPGKSRSVVVRPQGESGISISFKADGKAVKTENLSYIESSGGYCVTFEIDASLEIIAKEQSSCFSLRRVFY